MFPVNYYGHKISGFKDDQRNLLIQIPCLSRTNYLPLTLF